MPVQQAFQHNSGCNPLPARVSERVKQKLQQQVAVLFSTITAQAP